MDEDRLIRACAGLEAAFEDEDDLAGALDLISQAADARGTALISLDQKSWLFSPPLGELAEAYDRHWHGHDFRYAAIGKMVRDGIAVDQDIVTPEGMARMPYYTEFLAAGGVRWFAGVALRDGASTWALAIQRTLEQGPFEAAEQARLRRLGAGLSQSVSTARRVAAARAGGVMEGLHVGGSPALLLDRAGRVVEANGALDEDLRRELGARTGEVLLGRSSAGAALKERIEAVLQPGVAADDPRRLPVVLRRPGRRPLVLRVRALRGAGSRIFEHAPIMVIVDDLGDTAAQPVDILRHAFELTPAQARIAAAIGSGETIKDSADELGVGIETVRSGLKRVFEKVGVARQAELVRVISRLRTL